MYSTGVFDITVHIYDATTAGCAHVLACAQFVHAHWRRGWGVSNSLYRALVAWRGGLFVRRDRSVVLCLSIFDAGGCVRSCMCVYTHTHTHTAHGMLDVSPGINTRHFEGESTCTKSRQICIRICVQSPHMCIYVLGGGMRSGLTVFFFNILFLLKKQIKRCDRKTENSNQNRIQAA